MGMVNMGPLLNPYADVKICAKKTYDWHGSRVRKYWFVFFTRSAKKLLDLDFTSYIDRVLLEKLSNSNKLTRVFTLDRVFQANVFLESCDISIPLS